MQVCHLHCLALIDFDGQLAVYFRQVAIFAPQIRLERTPSLL